MKLKHLTIPALILVSSILNVAHAQTVSTTIPGFLTANGTVGGTRFTVNQTVTQPPGNLSISYFPSTRSLLKQPLPMPLVIQLSGRGF